MAKIFAPLDMPDGATISHDGVTYAVKNGSVANVPDDVASVFIASHGFSGTEFKAPGERIVEKIVEVAPPDDVDPNSVPDLNIDSMKRAELYAALKGFGVAVMPPITNEELRAHLRTAVAKHQEAMAAAAQTNG